MKYKIAVTRSAQKDINKLDPIIKKRIHKKLEYFINNEDPLKFAVGLAGNEIGGYRWRVGVFRVIFDIDGDTIVILRVRHRRDAYK